VGRGGNARRRAGRARESWPALGLVLVALAAVTVPPLALGGSVGPGAATGSAANGRMPAGYVREMARLAQERRYRHSRRGRRERARSRHRYRHLRPRAALRVAEDQFGDFVTAPVWSTAALEDRVGDIKEYLTDRSGLIDAPGGGSEVLESTLPLRVRDADGVERPVDLTLQDEGDAFRPAASLGRVSVSTEGTGRVTFGDEGFSVTPEGQSSGRGRRSHGRAFFPNTGTDSDTWIEAQPGGVEFATLLRSPGSPNALKLRFALPGGAELKLAGPGGAQVVHGDDTLAAIAPPIAVDAQGRSVPVEYKLEGSKLVVRVPHQSGEYAYPILVDPNVTESWLDWEDGTAKDYTGWFYTQTGPFNSAPSFVNPDTSKFWAGAGLYVWTDGEHSYQAGGSGTWSFRAPGDSFISRIDYSHLDHFYDSQRDVCAIEGFWKNKSNPTSEADKWDLGTAKPFNGPGVPSPRWSCGGTTQDSYVHCSSAGPGPCGWDGFTRGNSAVLQLRVRADSGLTHAADVAHLGGIAVAEADDRPPRITSVSDPNRPAGWTKSASGTVTATATDDGLGVHYLGLQHPNTVGQPVSDNREFRLPADPGNPNSMSVPCGDRNYRCPASWRPAPDNAWSPAFDWTTSDLPEGTSHFGFRVLDAAARTATGTIDAPTYEASPWDVKVDRSAPSTPTGSGEAGTDGRWVRDGTRDIVLSANDPYSGVQKFDITDRSAVAAADSFSRTVAAGWGSPDRGGGWSVVTGAADRFAVDGTQGTVTLPGPEIDAVQLGGPSIANVRAAATFSFPEAGPASGSTLASLDLRRGSETAADRVGLLREPSGRLWITGSNGNGGNLFASYDTGLTDVPGARWRLAVKLIGSNPTSIAAKLWRAGDPEPSAWTLSASDATVGPQVAGAVAVRVSNSGSGGPVGAAVDDLRVYDLDGRALGTLDQGCNAVNQCPNTPSIPASTYHWDTTFEQQGYHHLTRCSCLRGSGSGPSGSIRRHPC
jgi:hypothetical protein